jgi:hypothetical protein
MAYCSDCGTRLAAGICPNCSEELYIYREQAEDLPEDLSPEFMEKVWEQEKKEEQRNDSIQ